jgi:hypothetical protein
VITPILMDVNVTPLEIETKNRSSQLPVNKMSHVTRRSREQFARLEAIRNAYRT